jgi:hypothetical protein
MSYAIWPWLAPDLLASPGIYVCIVEDASLLQDRALLDAIEGGELSCKER